MSDVTPDAISDVGFDVDSADAHAATDACIETSDEELCADKCGTVITEDLCGRRREVVCPGCRAGTVCNEQTNTCCVPDDDVAFCASYSAECGMLSGLDNCGQPRVDVECAYTCDEPDDCEGTSCGDCIRESDEEFCDRNNYHCGELTDDDNCGLEYTTSCGTCSFGSNCMNGICVCPGGNTESNCGDGSDNDCDGQIDCFDDDCSGKRCGSAILGIEKLCRDNECRAL